MAPRAGPLVAACWAKKRHVLEKPWCKDIKAPLEFDEATVVVHQSPPEEICKEGKQDDGVGVDMPRQWLRSYALHWQDAQPRCSRMQFSNRRFILQRHFSSQDQHWEVIQESWQCLRMFYLDLATILNQGTSVLTSVPIMVVRERSSTNPSAVLFCSGIRRCLLSDLKNL
jgi:hypothetical protein